MNTHAAGAAGLAVLLFVCAALEGSRIALGVPWPVDDPVYSHIISALLAGLWSAAGIAILLRERSSRWAAIAWTLGIAAPAAMVLHALFTRFLGSWAGVFFLPAGIAAIVLLKRTFAHREMDRLRSFLHAGM
jgi:hypothetical protein